MAKKKQRKPLWRITLTFFIVVSIAVGFKAYQLYQGVKASNVNLKGIESPYIYIPTNSTYENVANILFETGYIINTSSFEWVAEKKNYPKKVL